MNSFIFVVKIVQNENEANTKALWASFDEKAMNQLRDDYNKKGFKNVKYVVEEVKFIPEQINDDDF